MAVILLSIFAPFLARAATPSALTVENNQAVPDFPNTVSFRLTVRGAAPIERIVLEYGVNRLTCGEVVAKAFPDFDPAAEVSAEWVWDMRQSSSEPPGARIWWQWRVTDSDGQETLVEREETLWLDSIHPWQELSEDQVAIHWYEGGSELGEEMLTSAVQSIRHIRELIDLKPDGTIDLYLYGGYEDMRDSILFEPGWTGGMSYGEYNIIILGVPEGEEEWGKSAIAHELMHTLVDRFTSSCLVRIPSWLHEGLAIVSEGGPGEQGMASLQRAIDTNTIFPLRSLGGGFPEDEQRANLAYCQSYSVVDFLMRKGDAARMRSMLELLGGGTTADDALLQLYGFHVDGLDAAWRESVGAEPLAPEDLAPTATPTFVPTYPPVSNQLAPGASGAVPTATIPPGETRILSSVDILLLVCLCLPCILLVGLITVIVVLVIVRRVQ